LADEHPFNEAGRRIKAALVSYQLGRAGVDSTLKQTPADAGKDWAELAQLLLQEMIRGLPVGRTLDKTVN
jgi:hypothetical protein